MNIREKVKQAVCRTVNRMVRKSKLYRETESKMHHVQSWASRIEKENHELAERTSEIGRKLCDVSVHRPRDQMGRRLRVVIEINSEILEKGLLHGDDATVIEYIGRDIGCRAASEIRRANFQRWEL